MSDLDDTVQLITIAGERHIHPDFSTYVEDIGTGELRKLYEDMVVVRRIDAEATALQRQGQLGLWAPLLGKKPRRSVRPARSKPTTSCFPATANTASPTAVAWN